jgi:LPXTG-site transpeptidase (sortase) family protein
MLNDLGKFRSSAPIWGRLFLVVGTVASFVIYGTVLAESSVPQTDQTPLTPLGVPASPAQPRYISGFGVDNSFTLFYEDRNDKVGCNPAYPDSSRIYFDPTTAGPFGLSTTGTATNICDTHLVVKNWPITIGLNSYAYRAWGAEGNDPNHTFYVSNNLTTWTEIYRGSGMFSDPGNILGGETIDYGFHDITRINNHYMGFVESAGGHTYIASSVIGDQNWTIIAKVGGSAATDAPLNMSFTSAGIIPTGNFVLMELDGSLTYAKEMIPGNRSAMYLAINRAAAQAATPALAEAAFLNPANWAWRDGSTGLPGAANIVLASTGTHNISESWTVPPSDPRMDPVILYTASYGGVRGIGCAASSAQCLVVPPPAPTPTAEPAILPNTGFAPEKVTYLPPRTENENYQQYSDLWLEIPALKVKADIVGVPQEQVSWDISWLGNEVGYLYGSAFPTHSGNSVITGHVYLPSGLPGPFVRVSSLKWGDRINVHAYGQTYIYEVRSVDYLKPGDVSKAFVHKDESWVTLLTCRNYDAHTDSYRQRVAIRAVLISVENEK